MLGFLGAILSAPLAVAGGISKGTGEALELGAGNLGLLRAAGHALQGAGDMAIAGAGAMNESISNANLTFNGSPIDFGALGRGLSGFTSSLNPGSQEVSNALVRAPEITAPAVGVGAEFNCTQNDIVCPVTPGGGGARSFGIV